MPRDDDEDADDAPRRRDRFGDDDDEPVRRPRKKAGGGFPVWAIVLGVGLLGCCVLGVGGGVYALFYSTGKVREAAGRQKDSNNLKYIGLGAHTVSDVSGSLPGPYFKDPSKPNAAPNTGLSHRVTILPYIEQEALYRQFDTTAAWDGPRNRPLANTPVIHFTSPLDVGKNTAETRYQGFVGPGAVLDPAVPNGVKMFDVTDGLSNTLLMVTADTTVVWSSPKDIPFSPTGPVPTFGQNTFPGGTNVLMGDGSVRFLPKTTPDDVRKALITRAGGEVSTLDW